MKRLALFGLVTLISLGACRDKSKHPTAPNLLAKSAKTHTAKSTVCASYRRKLHIMKVQLKRTPQDAELSAQARSLDGVVTDACN